VPVIDAGGEGVVETVRGPLCDGEGDGDKEDDNVPVLHCVEDPEILEEPQCEVDTEGQPDAVAGAEPVVTAEADAPAVRDTVEVALVERVESEDADAPPLEVCRGVPVPTEEAVMGVSDGVMDCETEIEGEVVEDRVPAGLRDCEGDGVPVVVSSAEPETVVEAELVAVVDMVGLELSVGAAPVRVARVVTVTVALLLGGTLTVPECVTVADTEGEGETEALNVEEGDTEGLAEGENVPVTDAEGQEEAEGVNSGEPDARMEGVTLTEAHIEVETDTELETEGDIVARTEPVCLLLTDGLPESEGCGVAQGVTLCVLGAVRDTEPEGVALGEPLAELRAERVYERVTVTVPERDSEGVEEGDTETESSRGLAEGEPEPLATGVAEVHPVTVTEAVEVMEGEREAAREGDAEGVVRMDAVTVEEAETQTDAEGEDTKE